MSLAHRSLCLGGLLYGEYADNTNDQLPNISHDYYHVQADIAKDLVYSLSKLGLRDFYFKLKQIFEGTSEKIGEIDSSTPNVFNKEPIIPSTTK